MAMKALRCPQCGAELELDDSKEFGFCSSCGTKIMLNEVVQMKHTGSVRMQMDNSGQGRNRIVLANRAFESGNYQEAYEYFTKALEDVPDDFLALYRKGICAVKLSPADNYRLAELRVGIEAAQSYLRSALGDTKEDSQERAEVNRLMKQFDTDLAKLASDTMDEHRQYHQKMSSREKCDHQAATWCEAVKLLDMVTAAIINEAVNENLLEETIRWTDFWISCDDKKEISYYTNTTTNSQGKSTDHYSAYRMDNTRRQVLVTARSNMASKYNNLSSRVERAKSLNNALDKLQTESDALEAVMNEAESKYTAAKDAFWKANPEHAALRNKKKNLTWISVGVGAVLLIVSFFLRSQTILAPILGVVVFGASFFVRSMLADSAISKLEDKLFPSDVKALGEALADAQEKWLDKENERREKVSELSAFEASKK